MGMESHRCDENVYAARLSLRCIGTNEEMHQEGAKIACDGSRFKITDANRSYTKTDTMVHGQRYTLRARV